MILRSESVARCGQYIAMSPKDELTPRVALRVSEGRAYLAGLVTCGSVWHCPVCAHKISEARRLELSRIIAAHHRAGGAVYMATLTVPHHQFQRCRDLKEAVAEAWRKVQSGRQWLAAKEAAGVVGTVRALEVTHGGNGWHPHLHILFFFDAVDPAPAAVFGDFVFEQWARIVERLGFGECRRVAFRFERARNSGQAGDYIAKWGADRELVKVNQKLAQTGQRSPWQILADIAENDVEEDIALFREYATAFKGARQLTWSKGLREQYADDPAFEDAELADAEPPEAETLGHFTEIGFKEIRDRGWECDLLEAAETGGRDGVVAWAFERGLLIHWRPAKPQLWSRPGGLGKGPGFSPGQLPGSLPGE